jgi:uncharacterized protein (TIGR03083 family)
MVIDEDATPNELLAAAWQHWAQACDALSDEQWATPTRCAPWDVAALGAHVAPDPTMFDLLEGIAVDDRPAVVDAAELLRRFNAAGGVAHTMADELATTAVRTAATLTPAAIAGRFTTCSARVRRTSTSADTVIPHPVVGTTTVGVMADVAIMEASVHHLDLIAAVGGAPMPTAILGHTRNLLARVADPAALIEVLTGRLAPGDVLPVVR